MAYLLNTPADQQAMANFFKPIKHIVAALARPAARLVADLLGSDHRVDPRNCLRRLAFFGARRLLELACEIRTPALRRLVDATAAGDGS